MVSGGTISLLGSAVVLTMVSACSGGLEQAATSTTSPTETNTTAVTETTSARTTTSPPTTVRVTAPPTTRPTTTTTSPSTTSTLPAPVETTAPEAPPTPTWPPYEPLPGVTGVAALTNLAASADLAGVAALAVKVDNHRQARPQWSLSAADVIFEENVEHLTRFIAIFHSRRPDTIGPIRSARTSDLNILAAFNRPALAWSGGNKNVTAAVRSAANSGILVNISALSIGGCYRRASSRKVPHNLIVDPTCALGAAPSAGAARPPWTFDDAYLPQGSADGAFDVRMDGVRIVWVWSPASGQYLRHQDDRPHMSADGTQVSATNVVEMSVTYIPSPADARSPEAQTLGSGPVVVHRNGVATVGTWSRNMAIDPFTFADYAGAPIPLAGGTTFVELVRA